LLNRPLRLFVTIMGTPVFCRLALLALAACAVAAGGCQRKAEGVVQVVVIGGQPQLADPQRGPLTPADSVLVANAAQGLVRFDAHGQIEPGLGETWNVSDDGLSYIFRLANGRWPDGHKIAAEQVARMLRKMIASSSRDPLKDELGPGDDVVAMTDRVIEIRLSQPRPHLLQLLAQPQLGLVNNGGGTGPYSIRPAKSGHPLRLTREVDTPDGDEPQHEQIDLSGMPVEKALKAFAAGEADLVLGGTFVDLPTARAADLSRRAMRFDPASGLFGLVPGRSAGPLATSEMRRLLSEAIDRDAFVAALGVPGLAPRATVLEPGLDNVADPVPPNWTATPIADRRAALAASARRLLAGKEAPAISVALPDGPGADLLFRQLASDWGALGFTVNRAGKGGSADFTLVDEVAPSTSASWFVRRFRCTVAPICDEHLDELLKSAQEMAVPGQRSALLGDAGRELDAQQLFLPLAAPIRWSLVSERISGFAGNRFAIHTLTDLEQRLDGTGE
jgi:oligopeptide transport system substrate-binding protein